MHTPYYFNFFLIEVVIPDKEFTAWFLNYNLMPREQKDGVYWLFRLSSATVSLRQS